MSLLAVLLPLGLLEHVQLLRHSACCCLAAQTLHLCRYACYYLTRNSLTYTAPVMVADASLKMDITQVWKLHRCSIQLQGTRRALSRAHYLLHCRLFRASAAPCRAHSIPGAACLITTRVPRCTFSFAVSQAYLQSVVCVLSFGLQLLSLQRKVHCHHLPNATRKS